MICMSRRSRRSSSLVSLKMFRPSKYASPLVGSISRRITRPSVVFPQPDSPTSPRVSPRRIVRDTPSTAFTAPTWRWMMNPFVIGKCLTRLRTSRRTSLPATMLTAHTPPCVARHREARSADAISLAGDCFASPSRASLAMTTLSSGRTVARGGQSGRGRGALLFRGGVLAVQEAACAVVGADGVDRRVFLHADLHRKRAARRERAPRRQIDQTGRLPFDRDQTLLALVEFRNRMQ